MKTKLVLFVLAAMLAFYASALTQGAAPAPAVTAAPKPADAKAPDPNFWIFLCFGQSNMEGYPGIPEDYKDVSKYEHRYQMLAVVDFPQQGRKKNQWYDAVPPLCRPGCGVCPADYFGRTILDNVPKNIKVGIINVAVAGCNIETFQKEGYQAAVNKAASWLQAIVKQYDGNPYQKLVDMGKLAQKDGVIKGILLHQGESNSGDAQWATKVKGIYDDLCKDLDLKPDKTPLLAGELTNGGGKNILNKLPTVLPNSYVIPSQGCGTANSLHFSPAGYKELGTRYAQKMLALMGYAPATQPAAAATPAAR